MGAAEQDIWGWGIFSDRSWTGAAKPQFPKYQREQIKPRLIFYIDFNKSLNDDQLYLLVNKTDIQRERLSRDSKSAGIQAEAFTNAPTIRVLQKNEIWKFEWHLTEQSS